MTNYTDLINNYLLGKVKDFRELEKLYDNYDFMKQLITKTKDIKYYNLCSHNLKTNIDFVIFLTDIFNDDLNLTFNIINYMYYSITITDRDPRFVHLLAIIDSYIRDREPEFDITYQMQYRQKIICLFDDFQTEVDEALSYYKNIDYSKHHFGFHLVENKYYNDQYVVKFFARRFLDKIFYGFDFEDYIHKKDFEFNKKSNSFKKQILANYVKKFDNSLYLYVLKNEDLLDENICLLNQVIDNYEDYSIDNIEERVDKFNNKLNAYLEEEKIRKTFDLEVIKYEEIKRLGLEKEFYGKEINVVVTTNKGIVNFEEEKLRLFIRTELQNIFKNKARKFVLKNNKNSDE